MADTKITALTALTGADPANDVIPIVDVSDTTMAASGTTKKISVNNILGASGTATLASATITGDLTVDTNVLKVDTVNNRVGVNTASPLTNLHVGSGAGLTGLGIGLSRGATANFFEAFDGTKTFIGGTDSANAGVKVGSLSNHSVFLVCNNITQLQIDPLGVFSFTDGAGGTRMTLNANGLGVGASPSFKFHVQQTLAGTASAVNPLAYIVNNGSGNTAKLTLSDAVTTDGNITLTGSATAANRLLGFGINGVQQMVLDGSGNVGIGVTPSAWVLGKVLEVGQLGNALWSPGAGDFRVMNNSFYGSGPAYKYAANGFATMYQTQNGQHQFHTAPSGTAGNPITFTQAMTLTSDSRLQLNHATLPVFDFYTGATLRASIKGTSSELNINSLTSNPITFTVDTTERMRLTSAGELLVGTTAPLGGNAAKFHLSTNSGTTRWAVGPYSDPNSFIISAAGGSGVYLNGTAATSWTSASDERLKDIIEPISNAVAKVGSLRAVIGKFKFDQNNTRKPFLIAQDLQSVLPEAVDASNPDQLGVAYTEVIPLLVAAIKELTARVQTLETR